MRLFHNVYIGSESGQHQDHKQPVGGHQDPGGESLGSLAAPLGCEGGHGKPERLLQCKVSTGARVSLSVVPSRVGRISDIRDYITVTV